MIQQDFFQEKESEQEQEVYVLYTSSFLYTGPGRICIARRAKRGIPAGYKMYKKLAPSYDMLKMGYKEYHHNYLSLLERLDPLTTLKELQLLAGSYMPVLLCWERAPLSIDGNNWCHRTIVANWFTEKLGVTTKELDTLDFVPEKHIVHQHILM